jgi:PAS domain S-box-containing protein
MAKIPLTKLKKVTKEAASAPNAEVLSKAFELFNQETVRLENAYASLKEQFNAVKHELELSNRTLQQKVNELDIISSYLNSILSNISQGILFIDLNGKITTYNPAAQRILGKTIDKVLFKNFWENFPDEIFGFSMKDALTSSQASGISFAQITLENGEKRDLEIDISYVHNKPDTAKSFHAGHSSVQGLVVLIRDITEILKLHVIANRTDRLKELGEMAAQVAHEIRNPLGGIKGYASLLKRDLKDNPELQQMAGYIVQGTDDLNSLVTRVLNYSRPIQPHLELTDIIELGKELVHHIQADATLNPDIKLQVLAQRKSINVHVDPLLLRGALLNLIVNSIQALPGGGKITLVFDVKEHQALILVSDTGLGIPKENLEKLYSPFFTTKEEGNGFGLAEVFKVVQAHNGSIEVESEVGRGTTFTIKIPMKS